MTKENPYSPPVSDSNAEPQTEGQAFYETYRGRARVIRVLAALLIVFSLYFLAAGLIVVNQGLHYWREVGEQPADLSKPGAEVGQLPRACSPGQLRSASSSFSVFIAAFSPSPSDCGENFEMAAPEHGGAGFYPTHSCRFTLRVLVRLPLSGTPAASRPQFQG